VRVKLYDPAADDGEPGEGDHVTPEGEGRISATVIGGSGNDELIGDVYDERFEGRDGDDVLWPILGSDQVVGGAGSDTVRFDNDRQDRPITWKAVTVDLLNGTATSSGGSASLSEVENVVGTLGSDEIVGSFGRNVLQGYAANDDLDGGFGPDELYGEGGVDMVNGAGGNDLLFGGADNDEVLGGDGSDELTGDNGKDIFDGGEPSDPETDEAQDYSPGDPGDPNADISCQNANGC
jgi:serralysin